MNYTLVYTPTLIEKLLGRWYKWWYVLFFSTKKATAGIAANLIFSVSILIYILGLLFLWNQNGASVEIITYLLVGRVYASITKTSLITGTAGQILNGKIVKNLIVPTKFISYNYVAVLGRRSIRNLTEIFTVIITLSLSILLGQQILIANFYSIILLIPFLIITYTINYFLESIISFLAFFIRDERDFGGVFAIYDNLNLVFFGSLIPINLIPFAHVLYSMPFAWLIHHPMQIYLGKYDTNQTILVFLGGIIWCVALYFLAKWVFKLGLKRNESVGL